MRRMRGDIMDYKTVTLRDVERMQDEIAQFYKRRKVFMGLGWIFVAASITYFLIGIATNGDKENVAFVAHCSSLFAAGIVMFILRSALYNKRIRNRKVLIEQAKQYQETVKIFENNKKQ